MSQVYLWVVKGKNFLGIEKKELRRTFRSKIQAMTYVQQLKVKGFKTSLEKWFGD